MPSSTLRLVTGPARVEAPALSGAAVLTVLRTGLDLARPWPLALAVDHAIDGRPLPAFLPHLTPVLVLSVAAAATVIISAGSGLLGLAADRAAERAAERIGTRLRTAVFSRCLGLSLRWHARFRSGELVSRLTFDVGRLLDALVAATSVLVPDLLAVVGVLALLLVLDPGLALLGVGVVPLLGWLSVQQRRQVRAAQRDARAAAGRLTATTTDLLRNVAAVQAFGRTDRAAALFDRDNQVLLGAELRAIRIETGWSPRADVVLAIGSALVLVVGGAQVVNGAQTTGHLLVVLAYLRELYAPVRALTRLSTLLAKSEASAERIEEVLDADELVPQSALARPAPARIGQVEFRDVRFGHDPARPLLDGFDLEVREGETVCLFGPSGIGKSTTLSLILRLYDVDAGAVLVNGTDVRDFDLDGLRQAIAYVPQDPWLLDATLAQNVAFGSRTATRWQVEQACRDAGVAEFVDRLPYGYDTPLGEGAARLSGGQRRRVAIARALVSPARLLLLDEPTASLDAEAARGVIAAVDAVGRDRTVVLVTHDPALAALADRVVILDGARTEPEVPSILERR